jgi:hypothetical protein
LHPGAGLGSVAQKEIKPRYEESFVNGDGGSDFQRLWAEGRYVDHDDNAGFNEFNDSDE